MMLKIVTYDSQHQSCWVSLIFICYFFIQEMSNSRQKALEEIRDELDDFHKTRHNLATWFRQKDRMIGVLGPVVTAPSLANNQLQQVRVLQEELDSLRPDLQRLQRTGNSLLLKLPSNAQETAAVKREVEALQEQLQDLAAKLSEREKALLTLMGPSEEFYELINKLSDTLPAMQVRDTEDDNDCGDLSTEIFSSFQK